MVINFDEDIGLDESNLYAAVDLGSNSFHLLLGEQQESGFIARERLKQKVQLLSGFKDGLIHPDALRRGLECLAAFGQRLAGVPRQNIRVAGTCALREARNRDLFIREAEQVLGVPVSVISGDEEARLIDLGVAGFLEPPAPDDGAVNRLVVDIGGGSTEFAFSANTYGGRTLTDTHSLALGCVSFTDRYFTPADLVPGAYPVARHAAVETLLRSNLSVSEGLAQVVGTSGSIESIQAVMVANGWSDGVIDGQGIAALEEALVDRRWVTQVGLPGLAPERVDIFPAGVAILSAVFEVLALDRMQYVDASLLQGMLHVEGSLGESVQARTVANLGRRFHVDEQQAERVRRQVVHLAAEAERSGWLLGEQTARMLGWAACLHEVGLMLSPQSYNRHGAYMLANAPLHGFSKSEQEELVLLVRGHRRSFPALAWRSLPDDRRLDLLRAMVLLRLAVILERGHSDNRSPGELSFTVDGNELILSLQKSWLERNMLSTRELAVEARQLEGVQLRLAVLEVS